jgi:2,3-bisphosphoglycerate-independent phosphoglycerate mutase
MGAYIMKYVVILMDGAADYRIAALDNKTPLQYANMPVINYLARHGKVGMVKTIPDGIAPGSDVANLSVMGYDPKRYYTGRSSLEAVSMGINLSESDVTFRCNLVTLSGEDAYTDKVMIDYSAGEISTEEAKILINDIKKELRTKEIDFFSGMSYRHVIVWKNGPYEFILTPPHDILDKKITKYLPEGLRKDTILDMMIKSSRLLKNHPVNKKRMQSGLNPANSIWIWGEGKKPRLDLFYKKYKLNGSIISAVDLIKGIGICAGLKSVDVKNATGNINTNFRGKADAAVRELKNGQDFVYIHIEAPDECSHQGSIEKKVRSIEIIDEKVIGTVKEALDKQKEDYRMLILPDHRTPIKLRTHTSEPVPFLIYDSTNITDNPSSSYDEIFAEKAGLYFDEGYKLIDYFISKKKH